jgi:hypothetical protein
VYHYTTLDLNLPTLSAPFVDEAYIPLDIDSDSVNTFMSAYLNAYNPLNPAATYLGDNGFSGQNLGHPGRASAGTKRFMRSI